MSDETTQPGAEKRPAVAVLGLGHGGSRVAAGVQDAFPDDGLLVTGADTDRRAVAQPRPGEHHRPRGRLGQGGMAAAAT